MPKVAAREITRPFGLITERQPHTAPVLFHLPDGGTERLRRARKLPEWGRPVSTFCAHEHVEQRWKL